ncbi:peptide/nickel transport system ATP-binding protein [Bosea sp. OK403]|uniref:ABC transporter ATP-binding protein n=1 Tax=Bosea sp. OK403 TaxID=1855286 RepID=UPI0008E44610|nr:ABC transporter ATP-binding protein [Bosea sp. OK403]SFJ21563.1 peptide/nickel transport system ATP-binding protein [Bosea sp. OK403]
MSDAPTHHLTPQDVSPSAIPRSGGTTPPSTPLLALEAFTVSFRNGHGATRVVHGVDLTLAPGEALGIVGESGCGKSVTWLAALRLLGKGVATSGKVLLSGQDITHLGEREIARIRGGRIGLIFQDPTSSLNPVHRIGTQIGEALRLHRGLSGAAGQAEALRLLDRVGIADAPRRLRQYPHELSGGMNQRVMIAIALAGEPDVLVADEPTTALDATIQAQILDLIRDIRRDTGMGLVLISHDLGVVADLCDRVAVMYAGRVVETAATSALLHQPHHPYTRGLLAALPELEGPRLRLTPVPGTVPAPDAMPPGCAFAPRCISAAAICQVAPPPLAPAGGVRQSACLRLDALPPWQGSPEQRASSQREQRLEELVGMSS